VIDVDDAAAALTTPRNVICAGCGVGVGIDVG